MDRWRYIANPDPVRPVFNFKPTVLHGPGPRPPMPTLAPVLGGALATTPDPGLAPEIGFWVGGACSDCDRPIPEPDDPFETYCSDCRLMRRPGGY